MDKVTKKRNKKIVTWVALALVVALLAAMPLLARSEAESEGPVASILSGTVEKGDLDITLRGGGNLEAKDAQDVTLADGVKITEFLVKNGDLVSQGDPLATVDSVSVMTAILEIDETLDILQEKLEESKDEKVASTIKATAGGRVKAIYAQAGDSVQEVMLEHGALAVLSLDGLMAVDIETDAPISTGDTVTVTLSDSAAVEGRVESSLDGLLVITIEDEGYAIGELVTVSDESGTMLGAGALYIHNAWKATAFTGTISSVNVKEEKTLSSGTTLFRLTDREFAAEQEYLSNLHRDYEELLQELFQMYETGVVTAPCDGQVSGVDEDSAFLLAAGEEGWEAQLLSAPQETGWTVMLLSGETAPANPANPGTGTPGSGSATTPDTSATYTGYAGKIRMVGSKEVVLDMNTIGATVTQAADGTWDYSTVDFTEATMLPCATPFTVGEGHTFHIDDIVLVLYDDTNTYYTMLLVKPAEETPAAPTIPTTPSLPGSGGGAGSFSFGSIGSLGGMPSTTTQGEEELFDLEGSVLLTVTPQSTMSLTITLDEQDIAKASLGQVAQVKVEALRDQTFEATVTEVSTSGTNNGGSSKFTVTLELDKAENMLDGMSATALLSLYTKMDVVTIPVKALCEDGARTVVYTALDPDTGLPASPVEVTLGASDGQTAEILSGLNMGDTYYYSYYDTLELDTSAEESRFRF